MADIAEPIRFGFLAEKVETVFTHGSIVLVSDFDQTAKAVSRSLHKNGYLYPPIVRTVEIELGTEKARTVPKTKRPAHLYQIPTSHVLHLILPKSEADVREESAAFIVYLLALIFETRLQFENWFIDGRIPIRPGANPLRNYSAILGNQLSLAYKIWSEWKRPEQTRFLNILYMFSRAEVYEWDWERFLFQYMILDACWKMGKVLFNFKAKRHEDRVLELYGRVGVIGLTLHEVKALATLRNNLFHEVSWHGGRPGHIGLFDHTLPFDSGVVLEGLNRQVIRSFLQLPQA